MSRDESTTASAPDATSMRRFLDALGGRSSMLRDHPGLLLTIGYVAVSLIGMMFSWSLFRQFGVNVFDYAEVSDFLMAALREPMTFLLAAGGVLVAYFIWWWSELEQRFFARRPPKWRITRLYARASRWSANSTVGIALIIGLYCYLFISIYAHQKAAQIRAGEGRLVDVLQDGESQARSRLLLGTTSKLVFLFDRSAGTIEILPYESLQSIATIDAGAE